MMEVKLNYEAVEEIFKSTLVEDYESLKKDIKTLKRKETLLPHQEIDLKSYKKTKKAYARVISYVFTHEEARAVLGKDFGK